MSNVYEVIEELRESSHWSIRRLATLAGLSPTTLTTILKRTPDKIAVSTLSKIASVFGAQWHELLTADPCSPLLNHDPSDRVYSKVEDHEKEWIIKNVLSKPRPNAFVDGVECEVTAEGLFRPTYNLTVEDVHFRKSIDAILDRLNTQGLMEALSFMLNVARNPHYTRSKEDTLCQEDEPQMAQVYNPESVQTGAGNAVSKSR